MSLSNIKYYKSFCNYFKTNNICIIIAKIEISKFSMTMLMLISRINFHIYIINFHLIYSYYYIILHNNYFITILLIIYFFIISFPILKIIIQNLKM